MANMDLYTQDRMERNAVDYDGSGSGAGRYTSRKEQKHEKRAQAALPLLLTGIAVILCIFATSMLIQDIQMIRNATCVEAAYHAESKTAHFTAPDGRYVNVAVDYVSDNTKTVNVYYYGTQYQDAQATMPVHIWIACYVVLVGMLGGCGYWTYKTLHKSHHAVAGTGSGKFDA